MKILHWLLPLVFLFLSCTENQTYKFRNDLQNTGLYKSPSIESAPVELWKFQTGSNVFASAVGDKDRIYIGSGDNYFYCLDAKKGELIWKFKTSGEIYSTAVVDNKFVYFLSYDGFLYKLKKKTGILVWKFKTAGEQKHLIKNYFNPDEMVEDFWDFYQSSPVIYHQTIYFGCGTDFYAVDVDSGEKKWQFKTEGAIHSSPAIKDNKVFFGSFDSRVYCLDNQTGAEIWQYETGRDTTQYVWLGVQASPVIENDRLYIGSRDALIYCFDINTGDTVWTNNNFNRSWMPSSFAVGENLYCGSSDGFRFYTIDKNTGKIIHTVNTNSYTFSSPAIDQKMAYVGSANGRLYGINLENQTISWQFKTNAIKQDTLNIYDSEGRMNKDKLRELTTTMNADNYPNLIKMYNSLFKKSGAILSSPVIKNQMIYFGSSDGFVYALSTKDALKHK